MSMVNMLGTNRAFTQGPSLTPTVPRTVLIQAMDPKTGFYTCVDSLGTVYNVIAAAGVGGSMPQIGETWMITGEAGGWVFWLKVLQLPLVQAVNTSYAMVCTDRLILASATLTVTLPNPITCFATVPYAIRNVGSGGATVTLAPYASEAIHGPTSYTINQAGTFMTDTVNWYCVGASTS